MIGILEQLERGARAQLSHHRLQEPQVGELITSSLHEQHRDSYVEEVRCALVRRPPGRMERESEEYEATDAGQG